MKAFPYLVACIFFVASACESSVTPDPDRLGWQFYPLETGRFYEYAVQEITVNPDWQNDTLRYELRTELADAFENGAGTESIVLYRYRREIGASAWDFEAHCATWRPATHLPPAAPERNGRMAYHRSAH